MEDHCICFGEEVAIPSVSLLFSTLTQVREFNLVPTGFYVASLLHVADTHRYQMRKGPDFLLRPVLGMIFSRARIGFVMLASSGCTSSALNNRRTERTCSVPPYHALPKKIRIFLGKSDCESFVIFGTFGF